MDGLDIDRFYEAIGFTPRYQMGEWDQGDCILPYGNHTHGGRGKLGFNREQHYIHCWNCGSYSLLNFVKAVMRFQTKEEAGRWLDQFGTLDEFERMRRKADRLWELPEIQDDHPLPYFSVARLEEWCSYHPWIISRGISEETAQKFNLRYAHDAIIGSYEGPAIVLPHFWKNQLVGWQYRWLGAPDHIPKYSFTKQFPRRQTLWGYDFRDSPPLIVVESVPTALRLISLGYSAVATFGANISYQQIELLRGMQDGVIIAPDNDKAGQKFANSLVSGLEDFIPLWRIEPPTGEGDDLGDYPDSQQIIDAIERRKLIGF